MKSKLTLDPETEAAIELLKLSKRLLHVKEKPTVTRRINDFKKYKNKFVNFLNEKTKSKDKNGKEILFYTHQMVRDAFYQLERLLEEKCLFTFLKNNSIEIPRTTNYLEGGINSQLRRLLKQHRGSSHEHRKIIVEVYLKSRSEFKF
ncbi:hypothetical protein FACS189459_3370 [Bacilli bacterium]|nr:hypothetical protein FACS189459_3370 [Bacilli bacterium]